MYSLDAGESRLTSSFRRGAQCSSAWACRIRVDRTPVEWGERRKCIPGTAVAHLRGNGIAFRPEAACQRASNPGIRILAFSHAANTPLEVLAKVTAILIVPLDDAE